VWHSQFDPASLSRSRVEFSCRTSLEERVGGRRVWLVRYLEDERGEDSAWQWHCSRTNVRAEWTDRIMSKRMLNVLNKLAYCWRQTVWTHILARSHSLLSSCRHGSARSLVTESTLLQSNVNRNFHYWSYIKINVKKLQFIHKLTASDTSKTAKITKKWHYPPAHHLNVNVLLSNITIFVIFAVLDVSLAVNLCINCSFFYIYICSFITFLSCYSKTAFLDCLH